MAGKSKEETEIAGELEMVQLAVTNAMMKSQNELTTEKLTEAFQKENLNGSLSDDGQWIYEGTKNNYIIDKNGNIYIRKNILIYGNEKKILPDEYQQVEYIESTGTQYITMYQQFGSKYGIKAKFFVNEEKAQNYSTPFGTAGSATSFRFFINSGTRKKMGVQYREWGPLTIELEEYYKTIVNIKWLKNNININGNQYILPEKNFTVNYFTIFASSEGYKRYVQFYSKIKLYFFEILNPSGDVIRNFVPCYNKETSKAGLYDTIEGEMFYNFGTSDDFLLGVETSNYVGDKNSDEKYDIHIIFETTNGDKNITVTLDEPLRKLNDKADYLNLANKKVTRYIKQDPTTGDLSLLDATTEENIAIIDSSTNEEINNIDFSKVFSIQVNTDVEPSKIE